MSASTNPVKDQSAELRKQLLALLSGGEAHANFDDAIKDFPAELRGKVPSNLPYSAWQLLEHMRITQRDILDFSAPPTGGYQPLEWPEAYWPKSPEPPSAHAWDHSVAAIRKDREQFEALLQKPEADLFKPFRWGNGQNLLRETLLIADHTAYHLGEFIVLRRLLGAWHK
ncbi:MAG: DinB family protein [Edaphobacter sp.]